MDWISLTFRPRPACTQILNLRLALDGLAGLNARDLHLRPLRVLPNSGAARTGALSVFDGGRGLECARLDGAVLKVGAWCGEGNDGQKWGDEKRGEHGEYGKHGRLALLDVECWKVMPILECKEQQQDLCFIYLTILELLLKIV
jgi:hypothetical protein